MDGVPGLEPGNDRIKICCLANLTTPQRDRTGTVTISKHVTEATRVEQRVLENGGIKRKKNSSGEESDQGFLLTTHKMNPSLSRAKVLSAEFD